MNKFGIFAVALLAIAVVAHGNPVSDPTRFSYQERPGTALPARPVFLDADGRSVHLTELSHGLPLILIPAYLHCPNLCGVVRASLFGALTATDLRAGRDYAVAVLSIDPAENAADARAAQAHDVAAFGLQGEEGQLHYLTGDARAIGAVTEAIGFRDRFDPATQQFIHPAGVVFVTAGGIVSNYLLGVGYTPADIRSALQRARAGRLVTAASPVLLICFHFDPSTGRYSLAIMKVLRLAGILTVLTLLGVLLLLRRAGAHR